MGEVADAVAGGGERRAVTPPRVDGPPLRSAPSPRPSPSRGGWAGTDPRIISDPFRHDVSGFSSAWSAKRMGVGEDLVYFANTRRVRLHWDHGGKAGRRAGGCVGWEGVRCPGKPSAGQSGGPGRADRRGPC